MADRSAPDQLVSLVAKVASDHIEHGGHFDRRCLQVAGDVALRHYLQGASLESAVAEARIVYLGLMERERLSSHRGMLAL